MKHFILIVLFLLAPSLSQIQALPRYALLTGYRCVSCHINPTGGQMRNEYGLTYSMNAIPLRSTDVAPQKTQTDSSGDSSAAPGDAEFVFNPKLNDNISIGGDYRGQFIDDLGSRTTAFQEMTATIYTSIQIGKKISLYYKQDFLNPSYGNPKNSDFGGPEIFGLIKTIPSTYIKGGAFLPEYGWRVDDHTIYTRGGDIGFIGSLGQNMGLLFTPNYKDVGVEAAWWNGGLTITASLFNGNGVSNQISFSYLKAYAVKLEYMGALSNVNYRIGASGYRNKDYKMGGFHAGIGTGPLVVFGEMDWTINRWNIYDPHSPDVIMGINSMAAFAELNYRVVQGLWGIVRYEAFDPLLGVPDDPNFVRTPGGPNGNNAIQRLVYGVEFFPYSFVEIRPQYRMNMETPSVSNDQALVQMHFWF
ncbi:MAG: hypothetical protein ACHQQQ_00185 [Bacteroidota bacterium]